MKNKTSKKRSKEEYNNSEADNSAFCSPICHLEYCMSGIFPICCERAYAEWLHNKKKKKNN